MPGGGDVASLCSAGMVPPLYVQYSPEEPVRYTMGDDGEQAHEDKHYEHILPMIPNQPMRAPSWPPRPVAIPNPTISASFVHSR